MLIEKLIDLLKHDMNLDSEILELKENNNTKKIYGKIKFRIKIIKYEERKIK